MPKRRGKKSRRGELVSLLKIRRLVDAAAHSYGPLVGEASRGLPRLTPPRQHPGDEGTVAPTLAPPHATSSPETIMVRAARLSASLSRQEHSQRTAIDMDERVEFNHVYREFTREQMLLSYCTALRVPPSEKQPRFWSVLQSPRGAEAARCAAEAVYSNNKALRSPAVKDYARSHYAHRLPPNAHIEVLPPLPGYAARLVSVREVHERCMLVEEEHDERRNIGSYFAHMSQLHRELGGHLLHNGASPSRTARHSAPEALLASSGIRSIAVQTGDLVPSRHSVHKHSAVSKTDVGVDVAPIDDAHVSSSRYDGLIDHLYASRDAAEGVADGA